MNFKEFDIDKDYEVDFEEFGKCFKKLGYAIDPDKLRSAFDDIDRIHSKDGKITSKEYKHWKEKGFEQWRDSMDEDVAHDELKEEKRTSDGEDWYVFFNRKDDKKRYEFRLGDDGTGDFFNKNIMGGASDEVHVATLKQNSDEQKDIKWAIFVNKLSRKKKRVFKNAHGGIDSPTGYWQILDDDHEINTKSISIISVKNEMLCTEHLKLFYSLLVCLRRYQ